MRADEGTRVRRIPIAQANDELGIVAALLSHRVSFVLVGEMAASHRGAPTNFDGVDICVPGDLDNLGRLSMALKHLGAAQRASATADEHHASFDTRLGRLDCIESNEEYATLTAGSSDVSLGRGVVARVASLGDLASSPALPELPEEVRMAAMTSVAQIPAPPPPPAPMLRMPGRSPKPAKEPKPAKQPKPAKVKPEKTKKVKEKRATKADRSDEALGADARPTKRIDRILQKLEGVDTWLSDLDKGKRPSRSKQD